MAEAKVTKGAGAAEATAWDSFSDMLVHEHSAREAITGGLVTWAAVRSMGFQLDLTVTDLARIIGTSERTIMRKEKSAASLSTAEADRAYRIARVVDLAIQMIGDRERAVAWVKAPHRFLGDETPIAMLETEIGADLVMESLYTIAYGGVA